MLLINYVTATFYIFFQGTFTARDIECHWEWSQSRNSAVDHFSPRGILKFAMGYYLGSDSEIAATYSYRSLKVITE